MSLNELPLRVAQPSFPDDVELQHTITPDLHIPKRLIEQSLPLLDFLRIVQDNPDSIGSLSITDVEVRQSRRWPFRHEYIVFTIYEDGVKWLVRVERCVHIAEYVLVQSYMLVQHALVSSRAYMSW